MNENEFKGLYYVFEYDIEDGYVVEYVSPCELVELNGNYIYGDTCNTFKFTDLFLCSYIYLNNVFNNTDNNKFSMYLKRCPQLLTMLKNSCNNENINTTKIDFENIEKFLKNPKCHNTSALEYFCGFANKKIPSSIADVHKNVSISNFKNNDIKLSYDYLKNNISYQKSDDLIIDAENRFGLQSFQKIYKILTPLDLFLVTLNILYQFNKTIKICKNCGLPFLVTKKRNITYCSYNGDICKIEGRRERERNRYKNEKNRLYRNIKGKFDHRIKDNNDEWNKMKFEFFSLFDENENNPNLIEWLTQIDNLFTEHKKVLFELPDINSI